MGLLSTHFLTIARWPVVRTTSSGRGHPEPRKRRHRKGSKLAKAEIRLTQAEKARLVQRANRYDLTMSEYVRALLNGCEVRVVAKADPALLGELRRQGNNFNQMMHAINAGYFVHPNRIEAALDALQALYRREINCG